MRRAAILSLVEFVFHEEAARRRTRSIQWFFPRPRERPCFGPPGGAIWTTGTVFNLVAAQLHRRGHLLLHRPIRSHGRRPLGHFRLERIRRRSNKRAMAYLALMFVFYFLAILLIARANTAG